MDKEVFCAVIQGLLAGAGDGGYQDSSFFEKQLEEMYRAAMKIKNKLEPLVGPSPI